MQKQISVKNVGMYLTKKLYILLILTVCLLNLGHAQDVIFYTNYTDNLLSIRWKINNANTWAETAKTGFLLSQRNITSGEIVEYKIPILKIRDANSSSETEFLVANLLDDHEASVANLKELFPDGEIYENNRNVVRQDLVDYFLNFDYDLIMKSGFGSESLIEIRGRYEYTLTNLIPQANAALNINASFIFDTNLPKEEELPALTSEWSNRRANLAWNTSNFNHQFFGYELQVSEDGGEFKTLDTLIINPQDTSILKSLQSSRYEHILKDNKTKYTFRIYGQDYLGKKSYNYSEVIGQGFMGIALSPEIEKSTLLSTNEVDLQWSILEQFLPEVAEWRLYLGENWDGPYELDSAMIDPSTLGLIRPLPYEQNYWRVAAVDRGGKEHSSFPMLVTHNDTIPPAIPTNLEAKIDTNGIVQLKWDQNYEKDFYGYKLFFGFDTTKEMTLANFKAFPESNFLDTIGLKSTNRDLFYKVTAVDKRNNRSPFSKIVKLVKPDILAPIAPNFYNYKSRPAGVFLAWHPSSSGDVIKQQLFRRNIDIETEWTLVSEWELNNIDSTFTDRELLPTNTYAYFVMAMDSSGNYSNPSRPAVVKTLPKHDLDMQLWDISKLENNTVRFSHEFSDKEIHSIHLYKKQAGKSAFELAILDIDRRTYDDEVVKKNLSYSYFIKVYYLDGYETEFSEPKTIIYE